MTVHHEQQDDSRTEKALQVLRRTQEQQRRAEELRGCRDYDGAVSVLTAALRDLTRYEGTLKQLPEVGYADIKADLERHLAITTTERYLYLAESIVKQLKETVSQANKRFEELRRTVRQEMERTIALDTQALQEAKRAHLAMLETKANRAVTLHRRTREELLQMVDLKERQSELKKEVVELEKAVRRVERERGRQGLTTLLSRLNEIRRLRERAELALERTREAAGADAASSQELEEARASIQVAREQQAVLRRRVLEAFESDFVRPVRIRLQQLQVRFQLVSSIMGLEALDREIQKSMPEFRALLKKAHRAAKEYGIEEGKEEVQRLADEVERLSRDVRRHLAVHRNMTEADQAMTMAKETVARLRTQCVGMVDAKTIARFIDNLHVEEKRALVGLTSSMAQAAALGQEELVDRLKRVFDETRAEFANIEGILEERRETAKELQVSIVDLRRALDGTGGGYMTLDTYCQRVMDAVARIQKLLTRLGVDCSPPRTVQPEMAEVTEQACQLIEQAERRVQLAKALRDGEFLDVRVSEVRDRSDAELVVEWIVQTARDWLASVETSTMSGDDWKRFERLLAVLLQARAVAERFRIPAKVDEIDAILDKMYGA